MALDDEQRNYLDSLDDFTGQTMVSTQYAGPILRKLREWREAGRPAGVDGVTEWARQRELSDWQAGVLAGLALAAKHDGDPGAHPG